jgi:hypothetical protein
MIPVLSCGVTSAKWRSNAERRSVNREVPMFCASYDPLLIS